jgi:hypothetical protein
MPSFDRLFFFKGDEKVGEGVVQRAGSFILVLILEYI